MDRELPAYVRKGMVVQLGRQREAQLKEEHRLRHEELHNALRELVNDFLVVEYHDTDYMTIQDLMDWSAKQAKEPDHDSGNVVRNQG